jgi:hypothetical protein
LKVVDPSTGDVKDATRGVQINEPIRLAAGEKASIGRVPQLIDADGRDVIGTFEGGESLALKAGDQVALLDRGGAIADTISI